MATDTQATSSWNVNNAQLILTNSFTGCSIGKSQQNYHSTRSHFIYIVQLKVSQIQCTKGHREIKAQYEDWVRLGYQTRQVDYNYGTTVLF